MRDPVLSRSRRRPRQRRLLRALATLAVVVLVVSAGISLLSGSDEEPTGDLPPTPVVAFAATVEGEGEERTGRTAIEREGEEIVALLDEWYQQAFVDPDLFGEGTFTDVGALFDEQARAAFAEDLNALTIASLHELVARVEPEEATAAITVYFEDGDGRKARWATAEIRFEAVVTLLDPEAWPVRVEQEVLLFLRKTQRGWQVSTYYDARQEQRSFEPPPLEGDEA